MWRPGTRSRPAAHHRRDARPRPSRAATPTWSAEAHLLRAAALIELGDPAGRAELSTYITLAEGLGHARGRWCALDPAGHPRPAGRPRRRGGPARRTGARAGPGDRRARCPGAASAQPAGHWSPSGVPEPRAGAGALRPALADVSHPQGLATRGPRRRVCRPRRPGRLQRARHRRSHRHRRTRRSRRRLRRRRHHRPAILDLRTATPATPAPTSSSPAAPPTTPPSTTTSARSPPPSETLPQPKRTSEPRSRCTNDSAPPRGHGCPSRP